MMRMSLANNRGYALLMAIGVALFCATAAYSILIVAGSGAHHSYMHSSHVNARYATESGMIWAMQHLWVDPNYCATATPVVLNGTTVEITITNCGVNNDHRIITKVLY